MGQLAPSGIHPESHSPAIGQQVFPPRQLLRGGAPGEIVQGAPWVCGTVSRAVTTGTRIERHQPNTPTHVHFTATDVGLL